MKRIVLALTVLSLGFMVYGKDWKYPEISFGKKIIAENSVETSYGTLSAYGVQAGNDRYMIWELAMGDKVEFSVFLKLNGKRWLMRIGKS